MSHPLITVIGSLNMDLVTRVRRVPNAGETLLTQSYDMGCGGKGANQAVACARLSRHPGDQHGLVDVEMVGAVGVDTFGQELVDSLRRSSIDTAQVDEKQGEKTGVAVVIIEEDSGDNRILMSPNANFSLRPETFQNLANAPAYRRSPSLLILQLEIPLDTTLQILKAAHDVGLEVLLNPAPAQVLPLTAYEAVTHLVVNESEAATITESSHDKAEASLSKEVITRLVAFGVHYTIVTLGARGVLLIDTQEKLIHELEAEKVQVNDTTAAGDTFVGAYAVAVSNQKIGCSNYKTALAAICWANKAAAVAVQRKGAQNAIPWLDEVPVYGETSTGITQSLEAWLREH